MAKNPFEKMQSAPDESRRVEDPAKAEEMARASERYRRLAADRKEQAKDSSYAPTLREEMTAGAEFWEGYAEEEEERAAIDYDVKKEMEGLSDAEVSALVDKAYEDEQIAKKNWELAQGKIEVDSTKKAYFKLHRRRVAMERVLANQLRGDKGM